MTKYNAAYINALSEDAKSPDAKYIFEWVVKLHKENVDLREEVRALKEVRSPRRRDGWVRT